MQDNVAEIKDRLDIVDVVGGYTQLKKAGANFQARCPFHNEKTPSFIVSPSKQIWRCFGSCDEGGDIFGFVMKSEGIEFPDALRLLADKAGIVLKKEDPQIKSKRNSLIDLNERATEYFEKCLLAKKDALDYLKSRGVKKSTVKDWRLGYAPRNSKALPMFSGRLMFPIFDSFSRVVGFSGRILDKDAKTAKYINSPDSLVYNKSRILYGFDKARTDIRKKDACILVEGNLDLILSHQSGVKNVVAVTGTALTGDQLRVLSRLTKNLILAFDSDEAGEKATRRVVELALPFEFSIGVVHLKEKDPADLILEDSKSWKKMVKNPKEVMDYFFDLSFKKNDVKDLKGKKGVSSELLPWIARILNPIERSHWLKKLSEKINVSEEVLMEEMFRIKTDTRGSEEEGEVETKSIVEKIENQIKAVKDFKKGKEAKEEVSLLEKRLEVVQLREKQESILKSIREAESKGKDSKKLIKDFKDISDAIVKQEEN